MLSRIIHSSFFGRITYAFSANIVVFIASMLATLLIPKLLGGNIEQYGFYQLYIFYAGFIGFFHLGLCDGIYLREGGKQYANLDKKVQSSQFWLLSVFETLVSCSILIIALQRSGNVDNKIVFAVIALSMFIYLPRTFLVYILQATNRIKEYSFIVILGRSAFLLLLLIAFFIKDLSFKYFVYGELLCQSIELCVSVVICNDIVFTKPVPIKEGLYEAFENIKVGINLLAANIAGLLITGIVRFGIQQKWDIATFGIVSFSLSVSNLILVLINAVALVLYPSLRTLGPDRLKGLYPKIRSYLMIPMMGFLLFYYPLVLILQAWLPQYSESFQYLSILFPLCIFSSKMNLLVLTYLKVYRKERTILKANILGIAVSIVSTTLSVVVFGNIRMAIISILVNQIVCCVYAENVLAKQIKINVRKDIILEVCATCCFILCHWFFYGVVATVLYMCVYLMYLFFKRKDLSEIRLINNSNGF